MISSNLKIEIESHLNKADELWCAVALVKDNAFEFIQNKINENCIQHYLVGIDLPTPPSVLRVLQTKHQKGIFECAIYKSNFNYHPKVYLIRSGEKYIAFIGSSNLTDGGLENNIELNYKVTNQEDCVSILNWFNSLYKDGYPLTDENISAYEVEFESIKENEEESKKKRKKIILKKPSVGPLDEIDFSDRFFKKEHHLAFRKALWFTDSVEAIEERELAKAKCEELHQFIFPQFRNYGIQVLEPNPMSDHLISMIRQIDPLKPRPIHAMWLSYGKNVNEIKAYQKLVGADQKSKQTFIHHSRLQLKIDFKNIGIYLLFAKENEGGLFDRDYFKGMMRDRDYRDKFYQMVKSLPDKYFISVGGNDEYFQNFESPEELHSFCRKDNMQEYFIIGKDYEITDSEMSENNLPIETLKIFQLLFPLYEMMRHKF